MMDFIAKNGLANYIKQHPEAQHDILIWLKEFPHKYGARMLKRFEELPGDGVEQGQSQLGASIYYIKFRANLWLKTICIDWVGTNDELMAYYQKQLEETQAKFPDSKFEQHTITQKVTITPPPPQIHF